MRLPFDVISAVTEREAETLAEFARGRRVLELGAHYGFSTIVLAQVARELHSVDWHKGDSQAGHGDNLLIYRENLRRHGVEDRVVSHVGRFEDVLTCFRKHHFEFTFIDGEHDLESVKRDLHLARRVTGGPIAFHDYGRFDVAEVVDEYSVGRQIRVVDWLAVVW